MKFEKKTIVLTIILLLAFILRLYKIDNPIADWHSWRQADTAAVARNFIKFGLDPLRPRYDDLSNIASGKDNLFGWRMVEFPLYQLSGVFLYKTLPFFPIEVCLRLISIFASVGTVYFLYKIGNQLINKYFGLLSAFLYAVFPYSIYYGRTILPEPLAVFLALASLYLYLIYMENYGSKNRKLSRIIILLSAFFAASSLLVKPAAGFILLPIIYLGWRRYDLYVFSVMIIIPLLLWRQWIKNFPEGIPVYDWLLNGDGIRFKGAWFYWLFGERIVKLILGYWGIVLLSFGLIAKNIKKELGFLYSTTLGLLLYLSIFATGNVKHDYYQIIIIPAIVLLVAKGTVVLLSEAGKTFNKFTSYCLLFTIYFLMLILSWHEVRTYYWVNNQLIVQAGQEADKILPKKAKVIAPYGGDTAFLYQTNRQGWPIGFEIEDKIKKGATYYISVNPQDQEVLDLKSKHKIIKENEKFVIIGLSL